MAGKGSRYRPVDPKKYEEGYSRVFGKCSVHPKYKATHPPKEDCIVCRRLWREKSGS